MLHGYSLQAQTEELHRYAAENGTMAFAYIRMRDTQPENLPVSEMTEEQGTDYEMHRQLLFVSVAASREKNNGNADTYENVIDKRNEFSVLAGLDER